MSISQTGNECWRIPPGRERAAGDPLPLHIVNAFINGKASYIGNESSFIVCEIIIQYEKKESNLFPKKNDKNIKNICLRKKKMDKITKLCKITY